MYSAMATLWRGLAERGRITEADCTFCSYYRTEEETRRPLLPAIRSFCDIFCDTIEKIIVVGGPTPSTSRLKRGPRARCRREC